MIPEIPGSGERRAGSMQNPGEETGWARCGAGPCAPRPPQTPAPTRTPQHPGVHLPARRCCRTTALRGHPPRYVPATPAAIVTTVPTAGPRGEPVSPALPRTLSPSTGVVPGVWGSSMCVWWSLPNTGQLRPCLCLGVPSVAAGTCARCPGCAEPPRPLPAPTAMAPAGTAGPGDPGVGTDTRCCSGGGRGRTRRSREPGLPRECGSVTPRGSDRGASRLRGGQRLL